MQYIKWLHFCQAKTTIFAIRDALKFKGQTRESFKRNVVVLSQITFLFVTNDLALFPNIKINVYMHKTKSKEYPYCYYFFCGDDGLAKMVKL